MMLWWWWLESETMLFSVIGDWGMFLQESVCNLNSCCTNRAKCNYHAHSPLESNAPLYLKEIYLQ